MTGKNITQLVREREREREGGREVRKEGEKETEEAERGKGDLGKKEKREKYFSFPIICPSLLSCSTVLHELLELPHCIAQCLSLLLVCVYGNGGVHVDSVAQTASVLL